MLMSYASDKYSYEGAHERLKAQMDAAGLTVAEVSSITGISNSNLRKILKGRWEFLTDSFWRKLKKCSSLNVGYIKYGM